jgi:hypothetical protein
MGARNTPDQTATAISESVEWLGRPCEMSTPPAAAAPHNSRAAVFASTSGVVGLAALVAIGGGIAYLIVQGPTDTMGLVEVFVDVRTAPTNDSSEFEAQPITILFDPCGGANFDPATRVLSLGGQSMPANTRNVVLIQYTSMGGASNQSQGQQLVSFLADGRTVEVKAAYHEPTVLYTLAPGAPTPFIPGRADESQGQHVVTSYTVNMKGGYSPELEYQYGGPLTVTETHRLEGYGGVRVASTGGGFCL